MYTSDRNSSPLEAMEERTLKHFFLFSFFLYAELPVMKVAWSLDSEGVYEIRRILIDLISAIYITRECHKIKIDKFWCRKIE